MKLGTELARCCLYDLSILIRLNGDLYPWRLLLLLVLFRNVLHVERVLYTDLPLGSGLRNLCKKEGGWFGGVYSKIIGNIKLNCWIIYGGFWVVAEKELTHMDICMCFEEMAFQSSLSLCSTPATTGLRTN
jgi:hypothetical protein